MTYTTPLYSCKRGQHVCLRLLIPVLICCLLPSQLVAQVPSGGSNKSEPNRPSASSADLFELLDSAGGLLMGWLKPREQEPSLKDPRWDSYESRRATVLTFLEAMRHVENGRNEAWPRVMKAMGEMDPDAYQDSGFRTIAWQLKSIFNRLPEINPSTVPSKQQVDEQDIRRFELFPAAVEHQWIWESLDEPPRGQIVLTSNGSGRWSFSQETIDQVEGLSESLAAIAPRNLDQERGKLFLQTFRPLLLETAWWGWLGFFASSALGVYLAWWGIKLFDRSAEAMKDREWLMMARAWRSLGKPFTLLLVIAGILFGSTMLNLGLTLQPMLWSFIEILLLFGCGWLIVELVDLAVVGSRRAFFETDDNYIKMGTNFLQQVLRVVIATILFIFALQNLFDINLTALLGGVGLVTLAVSLAAQDAIKNLFGALMVFMSRPFLVGDWIQYRDQLGQVEQVSLQVTRVRLMSGELWSVPNMYFTDTAVENLSLRDYLRREMNIQIPYDTAPEKIQQAVQLLGEILTSKEVTADGTARLEENQPLVSFSEFGDYYYNLKAYYWYYMIEDGTAPQRDTQRGWLSYLDRNC